jgi:transposase
MMKTICLGRNNYLFFGSEKGAKNASLMYSIIETAKMYGLEVKDYLTHVFREIMKGNKDCSTYAPESVVL